MVGSYIDLKSLTLEELTGVVNLYPWFSAAHKELCVRMARQGAWSEQQYAREALYIGDRGKVAALLRSSRKEDCSDEDVHELLRSLLVPSQAEVPVEEPKEGVRVVGGDYFSQSQYAGVRQDGDNIFSRFAAKGKSDDGSDNLVNPTFTGVTISNATASVETDHVDFIGTYAPNDIYTEEKTNLYLGADNTLYYPWSDNMEHFYVNAFRGYFQLKNGLACGEPVQNGSGINAFVLHFGKETNSIENSKLKIENGAGAWYDLSGRKLTGKPTVKGIYINNGKKVVIK